jgi:hypothetical protein
MVLQPLRRVAGVWCRQQLRQQNPTGRLSAVISLTARSGGWSRGCPGGRAPPLGTIGHLCRAASTDSSEPEPPRLTRAERRRLQRRRKNVGGEADGDAVSLGVSQSSTREAAIRLWAKEPLLFESNRTGLIRILSTLSVVQVCPRAQRARSARPARCSVLLPSAALRA